MSRSHALLDSIIFPSMAEQTKSREQLQEIVTQQAWEIKRLRTALRVFLDDELESDMAATNEDEKPLSDDTAEAVEPHWDDLDGVYRCPNCSWEIADGICQCFTMFKWDGDEAEDSDCVDEIAPSLKVSLDVGEPYSDRMLEQRGTTPLLDIDLTHVHFPSAYRQQGSVDPQFFSLLRRGATPLMCETFHLEFSQTSGIIAWADGDIYEQFAGPAMQQGDFWKIYLGRRICLEPSDYDGSRFLEAFLEENLLFPIGGRPTYSGGPYETTEESPGIWATKPRKHDVVIETDSDSELDDDELYDDELDDDELDDDELDDKALKVPVEDNGPTLRIDKSYETETDSATSDEEMDGCPWPLDADGVYGTDSDDSNFEPADPSDEDASSVDSDFDSDEVLTGDEDTIPGLVRAQELGVVTREQEIQTDEII